MRTSWTTSRIAAVVFLTAVGAATACGTPSPRATSRTTAPATATPTQPQAQLQSPSGTPPTATPSPAPAKGPTQAAVAAGVATPTAGPPTGTAATPRGQPSYPPALRLFPVTAHGARCNGVSDDTAAIRATIQAAAASPGNEVTFPPGVCAIFANLPVGGTNAVSLSGAGAAVTFIVQHTPNTGIFGISAQHVTIENVNLNTANANPGPFPSGGSNFAPGVIYSAVSYTSIINVTAEVGDGFGMRVTGPNPCDTYQTTGTVVRNVTVTNMGSGGLAAIDIDCTNGAQISNITIHGQYLALYQDENVSVSGETYRPQAFMGVCHQPWYITGPATRVSIANVLSYGGHGIVTPPASSISITGQTILGPGC